MLALKITDLKAFTNSLFIGDTFDRFWLTEASITTSSVFTIDGKLQEDFLTPTNVHCCARVTVPMPSGKSSSPSATLLCEAAIHRCILKLSFSFPTTRFPLCFPMHRSISPEIVNGFYLNLQYKNHELLCTTGTALFHLYTGKRTRPPGIP